MIMKNLLLLAFPLFFAGTINAQQANKAPDDLFGYYIGKTESTIIDFKNDNHCEIKTMLSDDVIETRQASWKMNEHGKIVFTDLDGNLLFELENQKGNWYERDKERDYTFKMIYVSVKELKKPRKGEGC